MSRREKLLAALLIAPRDEQIDARKRRFDDINAFISQHGGWTTSVPGAHEITFDALPGSALPEQLTALGYIVEKIGTSQRILPHALAQRFEVSSSGALVPLTEGSTKAVTVTVTNAGIATVEQYDLRMRWPEKNNCRFPQETKNPP
jgi:hypothetical protein